MSKSVELHTDASESSIRAVLLQRDESHINRPIAFISRTLSDREKCYGPTKRETLALVWGIQKLHLYLYAKHFDVVVDHKVLKFIFRLNSKFSVAT